MRAAIPSVCVFLALAGTAVAQPSLTPPSAPVAPVQPPDEPLSESTALMLSLGGTALSWGVLAVAARKDSSNVAGAASLGTMLAPSFGHWYAHDALTRGLGLRLAGVSTLLLAAVVAFSECPLFSGESCHPSGGAVLAIVGGGLYVTGTIDDIATAPGAARRYNHRARGLAIVPVMRRDVGGLLVSGRF